MYDLWNVLQQGSLWPPKCPTARSIVTSGMSYSKVHCDLRNVQQQGSLWPPECPTARFTVTSGMSYSKGLRWSPECPTARCIVTSGMFYSKVHCDLRNVLQQGALCPPECPPARFIVTSGMFYSKVHCDLRNVLQQGSWWLPYLFSLFLLYSGLCLVPDRVPAHFLTMGLAHLGRRDILLKYMFKVFEKISIFLQNIYEFVNI